ncbi:MADS-box transcription factor 6 [Apostasia shenzhenica]|uniref:MADS-box transcription factor 6 n=2 Tax=Apostasia TaxID=49693 RepID=A0A2H9ZXI6_9ASPA|nr:MADS-box transcription factor 6 [Apostasia shenzhenica]
MQGPWEPEAVPEDHHAFQLHLSHSTAMECDPSLHIGYHQFVPPEAAMPRSNDGDQNNSFMLGWML